MKLTPLEVIASLLLAFVIYFELVIGNKLYRILVCNNHDMYSNTKIH